MIILNTTFFIHPTLEAEFAEWSVSSYIPSALKNGLSEPQMSMILTKVEDDMTGFALQLRSDDLTVAERWHDGDGAMLRQQFLGKYGEKAVCFTTYMESISLG